MKWFLEQIFNLGPGASILYIAYAFGEHYVKLGESFQAFGVFILTGAALLAGAIITYENLDNK